MKISNRLKSLAGLIISTDHLADIGCDHALLDVYLVKNKIIDQVIVGDNKQSALDNGIKNINKEKLNNQIKAVLGDGLDVINNETDTVIISGMGTNTIIKILTNPKIKQIKKLIIQSNNDYFLLRQFVTLRGFYISHESVVYDNGKYYLNIVFRPGKKKYSIKELQYGPILMYANKDYYQFLLKKQEQILDNIPKYHFIKRFKIKKDKAYLQKLSK